MENIIELKHVNKIYYKPVRVQVLYDVNLAITSGGMNAIVGQSGSGKSTLLNVLGTLDQPTFGEVYINGQRSDQIEKNELAKIRNETIGFIFQFHYLLPEYTVLENVLMPYLISRKKITSKVRQKAKDLLNLVGLSDRMNSLSIRISGGQQQRTAIARALMNEPKIILADEPTGNLDSVTSKMVYQLFCKINGELKTTFVIITHDDRIANQAQRIIEIKDGKIFKDYKNKHPMC